MRTFKKGFQIVVVSLLFTTARVGWATAFITPPNVDQSQAGLSLTLDFDLHVVGVDDTTGAPNGTALCIPHTTRIKYWPITDDKLHVAVRIMDNAVVHDCTAGSKATFDITKMYQADAGDVRSAGNSSGLALGLIAIPYKWYLRGDHSIASNVSGGGYIGEQWHFNDSDTNLIIAWIGGIGTVQVPTTGTAANSTQSEPAFTTGLAVMGSGGDGTGTQYGLAIGWDFVSNNVQWVNNERMWFAFQVGYKWR